MPSKCNHYWSRIKELASVRTLALSISALLVYQLTAVQVACGQTHQRGAWAVSQCGGDEQARSPEPQPREQVRPGWKRRQMEQPGAGDNGAFVPNPDRQRRRGRGRHLDGQGPGQFDGAGPGQFDGQGPGQF